MDSAELRALQQPLKDAYREDPEKAVITLRARGQLDDAVSCSVETGRALAVAGLHPATGGDRAPPWSGGPPRPAPGAGAPGPPRAGGPPPPTRATTGNPSAAGPPEIPGAP